MTRADLKKYSELYVDTFEAKLQSQASHSWLNLYTNIWGMHSWIILYVQ